MAKWGWVETDTDLTTWMDAPDDDLVLASYLMAAYEQCLAFLPYTVDKETGVRSAIVPDPVPERFVLAQLMQARALYRSGIAGSDDAIGPDGLSVTVFPMDWTVKNLLRPKTVGRFA